MLRKFIGERYYCGLDIGAQSIKAGLITSGSDHRPGLLGVYESPTRGFKNASVTDLGEFSECIHSVLSGLMKKTGIKLKEIQLGIGGELIEKRYSTAVIPLIDRGSKAISLRDVKKVRAQARLLGVNIDENILHDFPQFFKVDDVNMAQNPVGLYGRKLEMTTLLITAHNTVLKNITKAVNQSGFDVDSLFFSSFSSAESALNEYQKRQGSILIDIGATMSDILIFRDNQLKHLFNLPLGGKHVTDNIAQELNLAFDLAEDIKKSYAIAISAETLSDEEILVKREDGYLPVKKKIISHAIEPIVAKMVDAIFHVIKSSGIYDQINVGIIMVGGGAQLPGLPERIAQNTHLPVKLGKVNISSKKLHHAAQFSAAVGLAQAGHQKAFGLSVPANGRASWASSMAEKVKELYQEYF